MRRILKCTITFLALAFLIAVYPTTSAFASSNDFSEMFTKDYDYAQRHNGNLVRVDDKANLLSDDEMQDVIDEMIRISEYSDVIFLSINSNVYYDAADYISSYLSLTYAGDDVVVFLIDMDTRQIYLYAKGEPSTKISSEDCKNITDNVYRKASKEQYGDCAVNAFRQSAQLLSGKSILKPMKYIGCALLALMLSFMINYLMAVTTSTVNQQSSNAVPAGIFSEFDVKKGDYEVLRTMKYLTPDGSGSGDGDFGGGGSGGGGGGGSSGGGHSF